MPRQSTRGSGRGGAGSGGAATTAPPGDEEPVSGSIEPIEIQEEMERSFLEYSMSVIVAAGAARRTRRAQAGAPPDPLLHVRQRAAPRPAAQQVRQGRGRGHGDVPPARRLGDLRGAGPDGAGVLAALPADRRPRQLRRPRPRRRGGGHALHGVPAGAARPRAHGGHRRRDRRHGGQLRRLGPRAGRAAGPLPEPARQRVPGHRRRHGDQRPAAQHGRGDRRRHPRPAPPRGHAGRAHGVRQGPRLPDGRADPRPPGHPRRLPDRSRLHQDARRRRDRGGPRRRPHRGHRAAVPDLGRGDRAEDHATWCGPAISTASARCATRRPTRSRGSSSS